PAPARYSARVAARLARPLTPATAPRRRHPATIRGTHASAPHCRSGDIATKARILHRRSRVRSAPATTRARRAATAQRASPRNLRRAIVLGISPTLIGNECGPPGAQRVLVVRIVAEPTE